MQASPHPTDGSRRGLQIALALAIMALLLVGMVAWQTVVELRAELLAANDRAEAANAVSEIWHELTIEAAEHSVGQGQTTLRQVLDRIRNDLDRRAPASAETELALRLRLAGGYRAIDDFADAITEYERILALQSALQGRQSVTTVRTEIKIAALHIDAAQIQTAATQLLEIYERDSLSPLLRVESGIQLARAALAGGEPDTAAEQLQELLPQASALAELAQDQLWQLRQTLAIALTQLGDFAAARALFVELINDKAAVLGEQHIAVLRNRSELATVLDQLGQQTAAITLLEQVHAQQSAALGADHIDAISSAQSLARILIEAGDLSDGEQHLNQVASVVKQRFGSDHPRMLFLRGLRAALHSERGETEPAEAEYRALIARHTQLSGAGAPETLIARNNLADLLAKSGRMSEALDEFFLAQDQARGSIGEGHYLWGIIASNYGQALTRAGRAAGAVPVLERAVATLSASLPAEHARLMEAQQRLAQARAASTD